MEGKKRRSEVMREREGEREDCDKERHRGCDGEWHEKRLKKE